MAILPVTARKAMTPYDKDGHESGRVAILIRSKWARYLCGLAIFSLMLVYLFDTRAANSISSLGDGQAAKVHLLIPLNKDSMDRKSCSSLASALIHGYTPTLLQWNMHKDSTSDPLDHMSIARLKAVHEYLEEMHPYMAEDSLVLMTDGHVIIFQLPQEHLLYRYAALNKHRPAGKEFVIAAADKGCHPNWRTEIEVCDAVPESPLPANTYGSDTGAFRDKHTRPRWTNAGMIVGTAKRIRHFYAMLQAMPDKSTWVNDQTPFNRLIGNRSELLTLDYYSQLAWTGGGDFDNFKTVVVPRPLDGILSIIPFEAQLPKLGMAAATGEIPVMMHFNLETGKEAFLDSIGKEEGMKLALSQFWWSSGEERFKGIAQKLLSAGRIRIYGEEDGREYAYTDICEKSFLQ